MNAENKKFQIPKGAIVGLAAEKTYRILNAVFRKH